MKNQEKKHMVRRTQVTGAQRAMLPRAIFPFLLLALCGFLALGSSGCAVTGSSASESSAEVDRDQGPDAEAAKDEAIPVAALPLRRGPIESVLRYSTNLEAESSVKVFAEASRRVTRLLVEEGDPVRKGQVLLRLEDDEQRTAVSRVESQLEKARREYQRQNKLFEQELISEQAFSEATYELEQLELALADSKRELGYATITAPISGVVTERLVSLGDYVQGNQPLFDIVDFGSIVARIYVPEKELPRLGPGQVARIYSQALGPDARPAKIQRIAPTVDSRSGTVKVTLEIPERTQLVPGMYVEVELVAATDPDALLVPKRALVYDQDQVFVFRVSKRLAPVAEVASEIATDLGQASKEAKPKRQATHKVERVLIRPALEDRDFIKVEAGLAAGDLIVVAGQAGLKNGAAVRLLDLQEALSTFADGASKEDLAEAAQALSR